METTKENGLYHINLGWFETNKVSFSDTAGKRLCPSCKKKLTSEKKGKPEEFIKVISECCSKEKNYIHFLQPVIESIFRLFLTNNNKPLTAEEIIQKLNEKRMESALSISVETVQKLLDSARFLGLGPV